MTESTKELIREHLQEIELIKKQIPLLQDQKLYNAARQITEKMDIIYCLKTDNE